MCTRFTDGWQVLVHADSGSRDTLAVYCNGHLCVSLVERRVSQRYGNNSVARDVSLNNCHNGSSLHHFLIFRDPVRSRAVHCHRRHFADAAAADHNWSARPPRRCRAGAVFVTCSRHVVHQLLCCLISVMPFTMKLEHLQKRKERCGRVLR